MPAYRIAFARPSDDGWERIEVGNLLAQATAAVNRDPDIAPYILEFDQPSLERFPTDACRNALVDHCQKRRIDYLFMIDADAAPKAGTFEALLKFLWKQPEPSIVGTPYVGINGKIQVFQLDQLGAHPESSESWELQHFARDHAAAMSGFTRVSAIGTHCCMFDMRVFDKLKKPYFAYSYNEDGTQVSETEDCYLCRRLNSLAVPIWCAWDWKAGHWKQILLLVPDPIPPTALKKIVGDVQSAIDEQQRARQTLPPRNGEILHVGAK